METNNNIPNLEGEIWKEIKDTNKRYSISNMGRVKSLYDFILDTNQPIIKEKIIEPYFNRHRGTLIIRIKYPDKWRHIQLHHIVAATFLDNYKRLRVIIHKNQDKKDNRLENIQFETDVSRTKISCSQCRKLFVRNKSNYNSNIKNKVKNFCCSKQCRDLALKKTGKEASLNRMLNFVRGRAKALKLDFNLDLAYLIKIWDRQNGQCAYTGIDMSLKEVDNKKISNKTSPFQPSIDKIDPKNGYTKGNIEFVCLAVNYAKNKFSKRDVKKFFHDVVSLAYGSWLLVAKYKLQEYEKKVSKLEEKIKQQICQ